MKKFLIVKTSALGDILHTFPVVAYLRKKFPDCQIDWVVENMGKDLLEAHPDLHRILSVETKKWRKNLFKRATWQAILAFRRLLRMEEYDCVFDLQGNIKSGLVTFLTRSKQKVGFAQKSVPEWPNLIFTGHRYNPEADQNIRQDYLSVVKQHFKDDSEENFQETVALQIDELQKREIESILRDPALTGKKFMVCPGSAWRNKQLREETLISFLTGLLERVSCSYLIIWGTEQEKEIATRLHDRLGRQSRVVDRLPLPVLQNLMMQMDLIISMDSLPLHLAATTNVPTYSVFGSSSSRKYTPSGTHHHSLQGACPYGRKFDKRCPILRTCSTGSCIRGLAPEQLIDDFFSSHER